MSAKTRAEMIDEARDWMVAVYGVPRDLNMLDKEHKDAWYERFGMLCAFIAEVFPE